MTYGKWQSMLVVALMAAVAMASAIAVGQDADLAERLGPSVAAAPGANGQILPIGLEDPAFDQYMDWILLGKAWDEQDAPLLADLALGLVEGERVLLRSHPAISARQLVKWAAQVAAERKDQRTLQRLATVAEQNEQISSQLRATQKLLASIRSEDVAAKQLPIEELTPDQFALYLMELNRIRAAKVLQDREELLAISEWLGDRKPGGRRDSPLPPDAHDQLAQLNEQALAEVPAEGPSMTEDAALLKKLALASRRTGPGRPGGSGFSGGVQREPTRPPTGGFQRRPARPHGDDNAHRPPTRPNRPTQYHPSGHIWVGPGGTQPGSQSWKRISLRGRDQWNQPGTLSFEVGPGNQLKNGTFTVEDQCQNDLYLKGAVYKFAGVASPNTSNAFKGYDIAPCSQKQTPMTGTIQIWYYNPAPADWFGWGRYGVWAHVTNSLGSKWWCFPTDKNPFE